MVSISENNKRLARNTMMLYFRMAISMLISIYTSRMVLDALGVEDYGIYAIAGGFVTSFYFINNAMAGASSRFISYELGKSDIKNMQDTFNMSFYLHLGIAIFVFFLSETIGLWFVNNKLVIPEHRMFAANYVYQLSLFSMLINITQTPYMACVMAHERMDVYAYVELLNAGLKLGIVFLLLVYGNDKLLLYATLVFVVSLILAAIYRIYCICQFEECHLKPIWDKKILKPMLNYSGWDLYGHLSDMARNQGVEIVLNMFFGPILNAASNISKIVQNAVNALASSITGASKPQIVKYYAEGNYIQMVHLTYNACKLNTLMLMIPTIPLLSELKFVMRVWLKEVPDYAVTFCSFGLIFNIIGAMSSVLTNGIQATGKLRRQSIINGTFYLLVIPLSFISFHLGGSPWIPFAFNVIAICFGMLSNSLIYQSYVKDFRFIDFVSKVFLPCISLLCVGLGWNMILQMMMPEGWLRLFASILSSFFLTSFLAYYYILPQKIRRTIKAYVRKRNC